MIGFGAFLLVRVNSAIKSIWTTNVFIPVLIIRAMQKYLIFLYHLYAIDSYLPHLLYSLKMYKLQMHF